MKPKNQPQHLLIANTPRALLLGKNYGPNYVTVCQFKV